MPCTKYEDLDKENPNYKFLDGAIKDGTIVLDEERCLALINAAPLRIKFGAGMSAYLETLGYQAYVAYAYFPHGE